MSSSGQEYRILVFAVIHEGAVVYESEYIGHCFDWRARKGWDRFEAPVTHRWIDK